MTDTEKEMKKYINSVKRKLNLPGNIKKRVMSDFASSIQARREAGMTEEEIFTELGTPQKAAADLNEQMKEFAYRKSPWRFLFAAFAAYGAAEITAGVFAHLYTLNFLLSNETASIGIIGGADGPTAIFVTTPDWMHFINPVLFLCIGIYGFLRLRKCKQK